MGIGRTKLATRISQVKYDSAFCHRQDAGHLRGRLACRDPVQAIALAASQSASFGLSLRRQGSRSVFIPHDLPGHVVYEDRKQLGLTQSSLDVPFDSIAPVVLDQA